MNVYIVGSKGIPAKYGGFETFVEALTKNQKDKSIKYYVSCMEGDFDSFEHNGAQCFLIKNKIPGPVGRIFHVSDALKWVEKDIILNHKGEKNLVYILGCRIGPLIKQHYCKLKRLSCLVAVNPDGLEWKRNKWNWFEKKIIKYCEKSIVLNCDYIIADSIGIKDYILKEYPSIKPSFVTYIAYGSYIDDHKLQSPRFSDWINENNLKANDYFLMVGRFVPENNYELVIKEFVEQKIESDLVIVSNSNGSKLYKKLSKKYNLKDHKNIHFVGTIFDQLLLKNIRENCKAYIHGHSVGGTNPSLLEAMSYTSINILYDVSFNRMVGEDSCLYFNDADGSLASVIANLDKLSSELSNPLELIKEKFTWDFIVNEYETLFNKINMEEF